VSSGDFLTLKKTGGRNMPNHVLKRFLDENLHLDFQKAAVH